MSSDKKEIFKSRALSRNRSIAVHFITLLCSCLTLEFFLYTSVVTASSQLSFVFWAIACLGSTVTIFPLMFICISGLGCVATSLI